MQYAVLNRASSRSTSDGLRRCACWLTVPGPRRAATYASRVTQNVTLVLLAASSFSPWSIAAVAFVSCGGFRGGIISRVAFYILRLCSRYCICMYQVARTGTIRVHVYSLYIYAAEFV